MRAAIRRGRLGVRCFMKNTAILLIDCPDQKGIVAAVSDFLFRHQANILHADQHQDDDQKLFLTRVEWDLKEFGLPMADFARAFAAVAEKFQMRWRLEFSSKRQRVAIFVSRYDHCLADLLYRHESGELVCEIPLIISNHHEAERLSGFHRIPFHVMAAEEAGKAEAERQQLALLRENAIDLVVLARYMQILSDELCAKLRGRAINIHHSFLPGFKGAKPYHQAYDRGVKVIGATAHYVTHDLDEGPIIEQVVERVDHSYTPEMLVAAGRDSERRALSTAVRLACEHRVFLNGNRTVVFK